MAARKMEVHKTKMGATRMLISPGASAQCTAIVEDVLVVCCKTNHNYFYTIQQLSFLVFTHMSRKHYIHTKT
jgi:aspartate/glutamate racemase